MSKQASGDKETRFLAIISQYKGVIAKVCSLYVSPGADFDDLYQEVIANLWQGFDSFRGDAKISTWIYRAAINTCITWHRRNDRHNNSRSLDDARHISDDSAGDAGEQYRLLMHLISYLAPLDKALVTLWLDEKSYDEIALITGLSTSNVAVKLHRIRNKLSAMANKTEL